MNEEEIQVFKKRLKLVRLSLGDSPKLMAGFYFSKQKELDSSFQYMERAIILIKEGKSDKEILKICTVPKET